jgi:hypothetical protein
MINAEKLNVLFIYSDGKLLVNRPNLRSKLRSGDRAGGVSKNGYRTVRINGKRYLEHRIIYTMVHGSCPKYLDHINGDRQDNRIENLRPCDLTENQRNKKLSKANNSGYKNVCWRKSLNKWRVHIRVTGKRIEIGQFEDLELAALVAEMAREKYHGKFCRHV